MKPYEEVTRKDFFAGMALNALVSTRRSDPEEDLARIAWRWADLMVATGATKPRPASGQPVAGGTREVSTFA